MTYDFDSQPVNVMLEHLRTQQAPRRVLRTVSRHTGLAITLGGVTPVEQEEEDAIKTPKNH